MQSVCKQAARLLFTAGESPEQNDKRQASCRLECGMNIRSPSLSMSLISSLCSETCHSLPSVLNHDQTCAQAVPVNEQNQAAVLAAVQRDFENRLQANTGDMESRIAIQRIGGIEFTFFSSDSCFVALEGVKR